MPPQDALAPLVVHVGVFVEAFASPVTGIVIGLLALWMNRQRNFLMAAAMVGLSEASLGVISGVSPVGLAVASVAGATGSLFQAWVMWPVAQFAKHLRRGLRDRVGH